VRGGDLRQRGADRVDLRRPRGPAAGDVRPADARRAGGDAASAQKRSRRRKPAQRLLGRRLLLPRRPRPCGGPDQHPPRLGRRRGDGPIGPAVPARARLRHERRGPARRRHHLRDAGLVGEDLVRVGEGRRRHGRPGRRDRAVRVARRADRQLVRGGRNRWRLHRLESRPVPLRCCTWRRSGSQLERALRQHRRDQARSDRGRLGHHADADGRRLRRDHGQRGPDEGRGLPARARRHR
jgi:hypothetical protein